MKVELESAVKFIISMLRAGHRAKLVRSKGNKFFLEPEIEMLQMSLLTVMSRQYKDFWFPESPNRGSAYRCIRINKDKMDPVIAKAAALCGLSCSLIRAYLPDELTLWVDPAEVSYRIGEEDGSICVLYEGPLNETVAAATAAAAAAAANRLPSSLTLPMNVRISSKYDSSPPTTLLGPRAGRGLPPCSAAAVDEDDRRSSMMVGPSASCFFKCLSRLVCCPKHRSHSGHLNGFSLLCMFRTCRCRLDEMLNERSQ